jgi:membrane protein DedA with SNARE-associated domain
MPVERSRSGWFRIALFVLALFLLVLVPFFLLETQINELTSRLLNDDRSYAVIFMLVVLGLSLDIFLPLPSTVIAATGAVLLGGVPALIAVWLGLSIACVLGYEFGASAGHATLKRMVSDKQLARLAWMENRIGLGALVVCRFVPVLAEVSVLMAGSAGVSRPVFYPLCVTANIAVAYTYVILTGPLANGLA